jgi:translation initiation factor 2 subunit 2
LEICKRNNPELSQSDRIKLPMPKIDRLGSKRTVLLNFKDICSALNRSIDDVKDYIEKTLTTQGSLNEDGCLILRYQNAKVTTFEKLMVKYVDEFVKCSACGRIHTELEKESSSRLLVMKCKDCKASRYIQVAGSATYKAQTGKRRDRAGMV